jgi:uncharacterized protein (DUF1697 family)
MRYIAFLRAINVGGHVVKMDRLRALFVEMTFTGVETFIASGNVIFESPSTDAAALEKRIEKHLEKSLGYEVGTFLRSCDEVAAVASHAPFEAKGDCSEHVVFLKSPPDKVLAKTVMALCADGDDFRAHRRELYWQRRGLMSESTVAVPFAKAFGANGTMRSLTTVRKLAAKYAR